MFDRPIMHLVVGEALYQVYNKDNVNILHLLSLI